AEEGAKGPATGADGCGCQALLAVQVLGETSDLSGEGVGRVGRRLKPPQESQPLDGITQEQRACARGRRRRAGGGFARPVARLLLDLVAGEDCDGAVSEAQVPGDHEQVMCRFLQGDEGHSLPGAEGEVAAALLSQRAVALTCQRAVSL